MKGRIFLFLTGLSILLSIPGCKQNVSPSIEPVEESVDSSVVETVKETKDSVVEKKKAKTNIPLTVIVTNLKSLTAPVEISIYERSSVFLDKGAQLKKFRFNPSKGKLAAKLDGIPYGEFGIAIYQDINSNGVVDRNVLGLPTEPYAFSNNFKPLVKKPSFDNCKFNYTARANSIHIKLLN
ncbi:MAG: DUF2141 domain-containing protein [Bacteroidetes bacterium]|nr:DUF2141 domain-containing protein [Bacteroidota bacterium]